MKESSPKILSLSGSMLENYLKCNAKEEHLYLSTLRVSIRVTLGS